MIKGWYRLNPDGSVEPDESYGSQSIDERRVARSEVPRPPVEVSTVFLGLDHRHFGDGPPILFESMIFGGEHDGWATRYCTKAEAQTGHDAICKALSEGRDPGSAVDE